MEHKESAPVKIMTISAEALLTKEKVSLTKLFFSILVELKENSFESSASVLSSAFWVSIDFTVYCLKKFLVVELTA